MSLSTLKLVINVITKGNANVKRHMILKSNPLLTRTDANTQQIYIKKGGESLFAAFFTPISGAISSVSAIFLIVIKCT
jgi:hypothetical protein